MSYKSLLFLLAVATATDSAMVFKVALPQYNIDILKRAVYDMSNYKHPDYGHFWSVDEILDLIAPPLTVQNHVIGIFKTNNITCTSHRDVLSCTGHSDDVTRLFKMNPNYVVPSCLKSYIVFVDGLSNRHMPNEIKPKFHPMVYTDVDPGFAGSEPLRKLYNITPGTVSESLVSVEYQGQSGYTNDDLLLSQGQNGLRSNPISAAHTVGTDTPYPDTETELDVQMESQLAEGAELWYWGSDQWLYTWAVNFFNTKTVPHVASHSWGWAIDQQCTIVPCNGTDQDYVNRVNVEYLKIAARGVSMLTASGDSGAPGRSDEGCDGVNRTVVSVFPGSSPYVLSVGATFVAQTLDTAPKNWTTPFCRNNTCITGTVEWPVNFANVSWTAGGGFGSDETEAMPPWQEAAVQAYFDQGLPLPTHFNATRRVYPDIAVNGHNCPTWQEGSMIAVDGTSCSSPTMAAIVALLNSHQVSKGKSRLGLVAPLLYAMYYDDPTLFNDIRGGNNWCTETLCCPTRPDGGSDYGYMSGKGYDPVTGLGTPNVGKMLEWLDAHTTYIV